MTTMHAIAIAVPLWCLATVAVARFLRYAKSDECLICLYNAEVAKSKAAPPKEELIRGSYVPPSNTPPPPVPAPEWPLRKALLLGLAHKWHERADEANRAGDDRTRDLLDQCAASLEREVRA